MSQPALSAAIRSLERELGIALGAGPPVRGFTSEGERVLTDHQRAPVTGELLAMFAPLELGARVQPERDAV